MMNDQVRDACTQMYTSFMMTDLSRDASAPGKNVAVLGQQKTLPKDRRFFTALDQISHIHDLLQQAYGVNGLFQAVRKRRYLSHVFYVISTAAFSDQSGSVLKRIVHRRTTELAVMS